MEDHALSHENRNDGVSAAHIVFVFFLFFFPSFLFFFSSLLFPQVLVYSISAAHSFYEAHTGTADKLNLLIVESSIVHPRQRASLMLVDGYGDVLSHTSS